MRRADWMERLQGCVENAKLLPFRYGVHDCCLWAARCVDEMCGTNHVYAIESRFNYSDEDSANAVIVAGKGLLALVDEFLGDHTGKQWAAPGDVVLVRNAGRALVGIVVGHSVIAPSDHGLLVLPYDDIAVCWKV